MNNKYFDNENRLMPHGVMFHHFHHEDDRPYAQGSITSSGFQQIIEYIGLKNILPANIWLAGVVERRITQNFDIYEIDFSPKLEFKLKTNEALTTLICCTEEKVLI